MGVQSHFRVKPNFGYVRLRCGWVGVLTKIGSVTAEILPTLSLRWWWWVVVDGGGVKSFSCKTQIWLC